MAYYHKSEDGAVELIPVEDATRAQEYEVRRFGGRRCTRQLDQWEKEIVRHLLAMCGTDSHILDAPCGTGRFFDILKEARELTMVDVSEHMLNVAKERIEGFPNARAILADVTNLPLPDEAVDMTICMRLFHHIPNDEIRVAALKELARVSKRYVALSFYNWLSWKYWRRALRLRTVKNQYNSLARMTELAKPFGLTLVERYPTVNLVQPQCILVFAKS